MLWKLVERLLRQERLLRRYEELVEHLALMIGTGDPFPVIRYGDELPHADYVISHVQAMIAEMAGYDVSYEELEDVPDYMKEKEKGRPLS